MTQAFLLAVAKSLGSALLGPLIQASPQVKALKTLLALAFDATDGPRLLRSLQRAFRQQTGCSRFPAPRQDPEARMPLPHPQSQEGKQHWDTSRPSPPSPAPAGW